MVKWGNTIVCLFLSQGLLWALKYELSFFVDEECRVCCALKGYFRVIFTAWVQLRGCSENGLLSYCFIENPEQSL